MHHKEESGQGGKMAGDGEIYALLPEDLLSSIFSFSTPPDLKAASFVCKFCTWETPQLCSELAS